MLVLWLMTAIEINRVEPHDLVTHTSGVTAQERLGDAISSAAVPASVTTGWLLPQMRRFDPKVSMRNLK